MPNPDPNKMNARLLAISILFTAIIMLLTRPNNTFTANIHNGLLYFSLFFMLISIFFNVLGLSIKKTKENKNIESLIINSQSDDTNNGNEGFGFFTFGSQSEGEQGDDRDSEFHKLKWQVIDLAANFTFFISLAFVGSGLLCKSLTLSKICNKICNATTTDYRVWVAIVLSTLITVFYAIHKYKWLKNICKKIKG